MFYLQEKLIESIQQDRLREAQAARLNALPRLPRRFLRRVLVVPSTATDTARRGRSTVSRTAA